MLRRYRHPAVATLIVRSSRRLCLHQKVLRGEKASFVFVVVPVANISTLGVGGIVAGSTSS